MKKRRLHRKQGGKGKKRGTWEGIKRWVCVLYCENALLATI